jgi:hypothetical protein
MTITAANVETASSSRRPFTVRPDSRLDSLLNVSPDEEVERVVASMARAVNQRTTIAVGRISFTGTQTVSSLSSWLKNSIITNAQKHRDKLQVASEIESASFAVTRRVFAAEAPNANTPIQAVVTGTYSPLDNDAEVSLQLISTGGNREVLASQRFVIRAGELERRRLSLLPETNNVTISRTEFESRQQAVVPYAGANNRWAFTVTPDSLDGIYYDGDFMTLRIFSERDSYFRIIHVDVHGNTQIIYPASPNDNNFIRAGQTRRIPDNTAFLLHAPFGEEMILVSAFEQQFSLNQNRGAVPLSAANITNGLAVESIGSGSRPVMITPSATAKFTYTILPK